MEKRAGKRTPEAWGGRAGSTVKPNDIQPELHGVQMREYIAWLLVGILLSISSFMGGIQYSANLNRRTPVDEKLSELNGRVSAIEVMIRRK